MCSSRVALGKESGHHAGLDERLAVLEAVARTRPWLGVRVTDAQLLTDVAAGYDALIVGADKWAQIVDPAWYGGSETARDAAVARLPRTLIVARPPHPIDDDRCQLLDVGAEHQAVSSTRDCGETAAHSAFVARLQR